MDDTSTGTVTDKEHLESLTTILDIGLQPEVRFKLSYCSFGVPNAKITGHVVDHMGLRSSDNHIGSNRKLPEPATEDELIRILGLVSSFAAFVDHHAETAASPYEIFKENEITKKKKYGQRLVIPD